MNTVAIEKKSLAIKLITIRLLYKYLLGESAMILPNTYAPSDIILNTATEASEKLTCEAKNGNKDEVRIMSPTVPAMVNKEIFRNSCHCIP